MILLANTSLMFRMPFIRCRVHELLYKTDRQEASRPHLRR